MEPDDIDELARRAKAGDRDALEALRDVYGLAYDEIAQQVGAPLGTVKAQIHHGRKLVRPMLRGSE